MAGNSEISLLSPALHSGPDLNPAFVTNCIVNVGMWERPGKLLMYSDILGYLEEKHIPRKKRNALLIPTMSHRMAE